jgi:L-seryl-tRNA(Ser) seleniumtransferase
VIVGQRAAIDAARVHPLARAVRIDKLSLAALEATLALYRDPELARQELPVLAMLTAAPPELERRAQALAHATGGELVASTARVGGGALPLLELPGPAVALDGGATGVETLAAALRQGDPAVIGRIQHDRLLLDPRTLTDDEATAVAAAVRAARP